MLAELAAANAAFDVIKQTIQNGQELYAAGEALAEYFGLKQELQKKAHEHGYKSDLDAFMAHEQLRAHEEQLKTMMVWQGRGGMWEDWLNFQAQCARARKEEEEERQRARRLRKKRIVDILTWTAVGGSIIGSVGLVIWIFILISNHTS